jgi:tetratricopeptide (TPR) repeat protein
MNPRRAIPLALTLHAAAAVLAAGPTAAAAAPSAKGGSPPGTDARAVRSLVGEGQALHDAGRYDEAIARYRQALAIDPEDGAARYEIAFSYQATQDYARCVESARAALRPPTDHAPQAWSVLGSCLDDSGKGSEGMAAYREGLARFPGDAHLSYNLAVSLWRADEPDAAVAQLLAGIPGDPAYASPYLLLGTIEHQRNHDLPALFALLRYLTVDRTSERSRQVGVMALGLFLDGVTVEPARKDGKQQIEVHVDPADLDAGSLYSALAVSRPITVAAMYGEDNAGKSETERKAAALDSFLTIAAELAAGKGGEATPEWTLTAAPVVALHERGVGLAFAYAVAERAGVPGAAEWLRAHAAEVQALEAALAPPGQAG